MTHSDTPRRQDAETTPTTNELVRILSNGQRRAVLSVLRDSTDGTCALQDLTAHVAAKASNETRARIQLHHVTIPPLEEAVIVEVNAATDTISYTGGGDIDRLLDAIDDAEPSQGDT